MAKIPTWQDRLRACFQWRHRLMHVVGVPAALGAVTAAASASALTPDVGLGLGVLTAGVASLLAGYFVTAGFDQGLVKRLQEEALDQEEAVEAQEIQAVVYEAEPEIRSSLERILYYYGNIEAVYANGVSDTVEAVLESSREDLEALRDRAIEMAKLYRRLRGIIAQSDGNWLHQEVRRMDRELSSTPEGSVRDALEAAKESTERTLAQWNAAIDRQKQIRSVLTMIESNLQEFKLAMELRKADAAMGSAEAGPDVTELQERLVAAGQACDELVGRNKRSHRRTQRGVR